MRLLVPDCNRSGYVLPEGAGKGLMLSYAAGAALSYQLSDWVECRDRLDEPRANYEEMLDIMGM